MTHVTIGKVTNKVRNKVTGIINEINFSNSRHLGGKRKTSGEGYVIEVTAIELCRTLKVYIKDSITEVEPTHIAIG